MPDFNAQLDAIARQREQCRQQDESLYATRLALQEANQRLRRALQGQTVPEQDRDAAIASERVKMARASDRLAALRVQGADLDRWFGTLADQGRVLDHLQRTLDAASGRTGTLRQTLEDLRQRRASADDIARADAELKMLGRVQADLGASIDAQQNKVQQLRQAEPARRQQQTAFAAEADASRQALGQAQVAVTALMLPSFDDVDKIRAEIQTLEAALRRLEKASEGCRAELGSRIGGLYETDPHPQTALARLDDRTPFLLFPVRIETIFVPAAPQARPGVPQLWVRIYPDDIAVHTHEPALTDREVAAGELYWVELVAAAHLRDERDGRQRSAWQHIVNLFGGPRAAWVARNTKPADWDALAAAGNTQPLTDFLVGADAGFFTALLALPLPAATRTMLTKAIAAHDGDAFSRLAEAEDWGNRIDASVRTQISGFPVHDLTKTDAWSRAPRTNVLPDRFVLLLYATETSELRQIPGALVPDTVFLGPDPLDAASGFDKSGPDKPPTFGPTFDWMADFDKAVAQGLGFKVDLSEQEARVGFARVMALGVRLSADAAHSGVMLEELITNHQFSPKGFSLVPQGTPTNNTEGDGTGYSDNDPFNDLAFLTEIDPPAFDPTSPDPTKSQTDGRLLADALGISYSTLQTVQHADRTDILEAMAMNTALFPSTLGYWLRTWMSPVVTDDAARQTRSFFTRLVTGRGPLPAVRVGNQPYGILVTSDLSRWKYPATPEGVLTLVSVFDGAADFLSRLHQLLLHLDGTWKGLADALPYVGRPGTDSSDVLMNLLGLHPASVEFFQRVGFSDEYLRNMDNFTDRGRYANELASLVLSMPATARLHLQNLGFTDDIASVGKMRSLHVLWQHYITSLGVPNLVDSKPASETQALSVNYIDWLAKATDTAKIMNQQFDGPVPSALLYLMLRNAILLQLHQGAYEWLVERSTFDTALSQSVGATTLAGMRTAAPTLSKFELMTTRVDLVEPSHPAPSTTVSDWIWRGPDPTEIEAAFVKQQRAALALLAPVTTARLERCFVEHLDCCQYRLDAWETGLFTERLQARRNWGSSERDTGIYLGAFGWVENVVPSPKTFLTAESLPVSIRPDDGQPILEEDEVAGASPSRAGLRQGGFMHAPSLNHASAGALLRNAYLSHASPEQPDLFSVNLSSERVRRAQFVLEGMRNGQPIEAVLGYQFERGLHDRTSESAKRGDVPVLELNEFIVPYRQAFPFQSREIVQTGTGAASPTVPAYSVVNGLSLSTATLSSANAYGLNAVLPVAQPNAAQGAAVLAERDALLDTVDAVKDLLMAENAYQLVQGNFDRVAAVSLAQKDARIPPALEVIKTPRGSEFTFTNRLTLHFDDLDESLPSSNPWPTVAMTPRANAEPGMNYWIGEVLGRHPEAIQCTVSRDAGIDSHVVTLADLGIQPIDVVGLVGIATNDTHGATELETRIAYYYRRTWGIANDATVHIDFDPPGDPNDTTFARLFPLARHLRPLLSGSRALRATDFLPSAGGKATTIPLDATNPEGYDAVELKNRVQRGIDALTTLADALDGPAAPPVSLVLLHEPDDISDDEPFAGSLGDAFTKLEAERLTFTDRTALTVTFLTAHAETLHLTLQAVAGFGISDALPPEADVSTDAAKAALLARAHRVARRLRNANPKDGVLDRAVAAMSDATPDKPIGRQVTSLLDAAKALFAETISLLPAFTCANDIDLSAADGARGQLLAFALGAAPGLTAPDIVDEWIQPLARVRPQVYRWELVRALADGLNDVALEFRPVQVPYRAKDSWLAVELPKVDPSDPTKPFGISRDTLSIAAHGAAAFKPHAQRGLLLDEWTEEIPSRGEITGVSFRFNQPNAAPPQSLLLAVTPEETESWNWDSLVGTLVDTLARAKRRAVEPSQLEKQGLVWNAFAPALVSEFSKVAQADVSLDLMTMVSYSPLSEFYAVRSTK